MPIEFGRQFRRNVGKWAGIWGAFGRISKGGFSMESATDKDARQCGRLAVLQPAFNKRVAWVACLCRWSGGKAGGKDGGGESVHWRGAKISPTNHAGPTNAE